MKNPFKCLVVGFVFGAGQITFPQPNRIPYNNQKLFLSGANLAWINPESKAKDIGPCPTDFDSFAEILLTMHDHGGNAARWWLHTNGTVTPAFDDSGFVIGPGEGAIEDLKKALDLAWYREIGLILCLWSFDMLHKDINDTVRNRNRLLLTDTTYTLRYINNCLIPMVDSVKGHPGIIAWEIFNEPEVMSKEFGDTCVVDVKDLVPMSDIQRFINLCAGIIHTRDSIVQVTSGARNFVTLTDREVVLKLECSRSHASFNYYADERLIAAGGNLAGILNFHSAHYYKGFGPDLSPFHHPASWWGLDKPIVVAEFGMKDMLEVSTENLFETLYQNGYAGALPWSWTDTTHSTHDQMLAGMKHMWDNHRADVDVNGISGVFPTVQIISPDSAAEFPKGAEVEITATASDNDGFVDSVRFLAVEFFTSDTTIIGETNAVSDTITWSNTSPGAYSLIAVAKDNWGNKRASKRVPIKIGSPQTVRFEAEAATRDGGVFEVLPDPTASNGTFLRMKDDKGTITWTLSTAAAGNCGIVFGYRLPYEPKTQSLKVNGESLPDVKFIGEICTWLKKKLNVPLKQGSNVIQMELSQGWMDLDYLDFPNNYSVSVADHSEVPISFFLQQNHPNPFNPVTSIRYSLAKPEHAKLIVYDLMGRPVKVLVDEKQDVGHYEISFDGRNLTSGVYFYHLEAGSFVDEKRMLLVK